MPLGPSFDPLSIEQYMEKRVTSAARAAVERANERYRPVLDRVFQTFLDRLEADPMFRAQMARLTREEYEDAFGVVVMARLKADPRYQRVRAAIERRLVQAELEARLGENRAILAGIETRDPVILAAIEAEWRTLHPDEPL